LQVSLRETCGAVRDRLGDAVRFTITPLGGVGHGVDELVAAIVRYLCPDEPSPPAPAAVQPSRPGGGGAARYYADRGDEPGRWLGRDAAHAGLVGEVDPVDFGRVLAGRDPLTGRRLITAQGSAGRRPQLGVGAATRTGPDGEPWYDEHDAAAVLGTTADEIGQMLDIGATLTAAGGSAVPGSIPGRVPGSIPGSANAQVTTHPPASYLMPVVDANGDRWVTDRELSRCETARAAGVSADQITAAGGADDQLSLKEAARLAGVTAQYLARLARKYDHDRARIDAATAAGRQPRGAHLVAHRGTRGRWLVTRQHLAEFLERRQPPAVRVGYDVTLSTEKSLGVLALLGDDATRTAVLDAIRHGNDTALRWLEDHAAAARVRGETVPVDGWTAASFQHLTSRALDPFPHHHNVIANTVIGPDGERRALDARGLYAHAQAGSAIATAEMRYKLTYGLGARWRPGRKDGWEIDGIPEAVLRDFSRRRNEIDDALRELEAEIGRGVSPDELEHVVLATRPPKQHATVDALHAEWWQRAAALGFTPDQLAAVTGRSIPKRPIDIDAIHVALAAPNGICTNLSVFNRGDLLQHLVNLPDPTTGRNLDDPNDTPQPLIVNGAQLEALADSFLASAHVVELPGGRYTTDDMLGVQRRIVARYRAGLHQHTAVVRPELVDAALAARPELSDEQQALVRAFCTSGHRQQCAIGRAGSGKTTAMAAAVDAWTAAGRRVIGAAVKGEAARTLAAATGIHTETLAWYLAHPDPHTAPLDARTVLIVDEASTISDRDLDRLGWLAHTTGATLRLIGDPAQHGAVEAGGMYRVLCEQNSKHTPELKLTHRLRDPHDRAAADALRAGQVDEALDQLAQAGHLHIVGDELSVYRDVLARWWNAHLNGADHPMVDRRNSTRRELNRLAHLLLHTHGHIGTQELIASGDRRFSIGDRVIARAPARQLHPPGQPRNYIRNGATGTITITALDHRDGEGQDDAIQVAFDGIGTITIPRSFYDHHTAPGGGTEVGIDHAYALTSYAVQGATNPVSTSRIDPTATRAETYVDITRGRDENHLYITAPNDPLDGEALPTLPPTPVDEAAAHRLRTSRGERTAYELHQAARRHALDGPEPGQAVGL